jgi:hypothetical protein
MPKTTVSITTKEQKVIDKFNKKKMEVVRGFKDLKAQLKDINDNAPKVNKKN